MSSTTDSPELQPTEVGAGSDPQGDRSIGVEQTRTTGLLERPRQAGETMVGPAGANDVTVVFEDQTGASSWTCSGNKKRPNIRWAMWKISSIPAGP